MALRARTAALSTLTIKRPNSDFQGRRSVSSPDPGFDGGSAAGCPMGACGGLGRGKLVLALRASTRRESSTLSQDAGGSIPPRRSPTKRSCAPPRLPGSSPRACPLAVSFGEPAGSRPAERHPLANVAVIGSTPIGLFRAVAQWKSTTHTCHVCSNQGIGGDASTRRRFPSRSPRGSRSCARLPRETSARRGSTTGREPRVRSRASPPLAQARARFVLDASSALRARGHGPRGEPLVVHGPFGRMTGTRSGPVVCGVPVGRLTFAHGACRDGDAPLRAARPRSEVVVVAQRSAHAWTSSVRRLPRNPFFPPRPPSSTAVAQSRVLLHCPSRKAHGEPRR